MARRVPSALLGAPGAAAPGRPGPLPGDGPRSAAGGGRPAEVALPDRRGRIGRHGLRARDAPPPRPPPGRLRRLALRPPGPPRPRRDLASSVHGPCGEGTAAGARGTRRRRTGGDHPIGVAGGRRLVGALTRCRSVGPRPLASGPRGPRRHRGGPVQAARGRSVAPGRPQRRPRSTRADTAERCQILQSAPQ